MAKYAYWLRVCRCENDKRGGSEEDALIGFSVVVRPLASLECHSSLTQVESFGISVMFSFTQSQALVVEAAVMQAVMFKKIPL